MIVGIHVTKPFSDGLCHQRGEALYTVGIVSVKSSRLG